MASYGVFLAACGFTYNGPEGHIGFAPKLTPENFKAAFTAAEGWGSYSQKIGNGKLNAEITIKWGQLRLRSISLPADIAPKKAMVEVKGKTIPAGFRHADGKCHLTLLNDVLLRSGENLRITLECE